MYQRLRLFSLLILFVLAGTGAQTEAEALSASDFTLLLTEVFYDTPGNDAEEEWIEIVNVGTVAVDLADVKVGDEETIGGREGMKRFPEGAVIEPAQVIVVAQTAIGFRTLVGGNPDYEITDTDAGVPDMRNFSLWATGDLALANEGDEVVLLQGMAVIDAINYGDSTAYFAPAIGRAFTGQSIERVPADCDTNSAADWQPQQAPTPGEINFEGECMAPVNPADLEELPPIGEIQGTMNVSPYINQVVTFRGLVTGFYEDRNTRGITFYTLFVQDMPGREDGDAATSDGIAVFLGRQRPTYAIGDQVRMTGLVTEFFGFTEIDEDELEILVEGSDTPLPDPVAIAPPADNEAQVAYFEPLESMRVAVDGAAPVAGPTFSGCAFAIQVRQDVDPVRVFRHHLDDPVGRVVPILHHSDVTCDGFPDVKSGDRVEGIVGPLIYHFDQFKIVQQAPEALAITPSLLAPLEEPPTLATRQFSVASFNLENHFDAIDDTGSDEEPKPTVEEIATREAKLAHAIAHTLGCPTIIGVQEVEKEALLLDLAATVAEACGFTYAVTHRESVDVRGIDVALLSDPRRVRVLDGRLRQGCTTINTGIADTAVDCPVGQSPLFSRPPLQVDVEVDGQVYTFVVNHFKSKREGESATAARRLAQARHINEMVSALLVEDEASRIVVMGDFNDYDQSPPLLLMTEGDDRLKNVLLKVPESERYSFIFGGVAQLIDGILVSPALVDEVVAVTIQHTNADYPQAWGTDLSPAHLPYRATDHDLPLLLLALPEVVTEDSQVIVPATATAAPVEQSISAVDNNPNRSGWTAAGLLMAALVSAIVLWRRSLIHRSARHRAKQRGQADS